MRPQRPDALVAFCPTPYCGRMVAARHGGVGYLETLGAALHQDIDVFWTGPEIVSARDRRSRTSGTWRGCCAAQPILWDNLHANDYDGRRMLLGPYAGRPLALRDEVRGILTQPEHRVPARLHGAADALAVPAAPTAPGTSATRS